MKYYFSEYDGFISSQSSAIFGKFTHQLVKNVSYLLIRTS